MTDTPLVHIVDDDAGLRKSLQSTLESAGIATQTYESAEEFLSQFKPSRPGCVLMDLRMPGLDGIALLQSLRATHCDIPVIIMSGHADVAATVQGMKLGAIDVLVKPFEPLLVKSLVEKAVQDSITMQGRHEETEHVRHRFSSLTARERELLKLVVAGHSNKQIAYELHISIKTVANHRAHLMEKTQAMNAPDLARLNMLAGETN